MTETTPRPIVLADVFRLLQDPELHWETLRPGIEIHRLYKWPTGQSAALLRYAPGAVLSAHRHVAFEHIFVLTGTQTDENGVHRAGALIVNPPGSRHSVKSENGCTVLAIWEQPVVFDNT
jgi:anti-sigma factor ChrR (cupin superfamily)